MTPQSRSSMDGQLVDLDTMTPEERNAYTRDGRVLALSKKPRAQITRQDLQDASSDEYFQSRVWRAKDTPDALFRIMGKPYFVLEYYMKLALS